MVYVLSCFSTGDPTQQDMDIILLLSQRAYYVAKWAILYKYPFLQFTFPQWRGGGIQIDFSSLQAFVVATAQL